MSNRTCAVCGDEIPMDRADELCESCREDAENGIDTTLVLRRRAARAALRCTCDIPGLKQCDLHGPRE